MIELILPATPVACLQWHCLRHTHAIVLLSTLEEVTVSELPQSTSGEQRADIFTATTGLQNYHKMAPDLPAGRMAVIRDAPCPRSATNWRVWWSHCGTCRVASDSAESPTPSRAAGSRVPFECDLVKAVTRVWYSTTGSNMVLELRLICTYRL